MNDRLRSHRGLASLFSRSLLDSIWQRRTHRVSSGAKVNAGTLSYESKRAPEPLSELEEAVLIAITGHSGLTMPDRPLFTPQGDDTIMAKPNLTMRGRTAGSPDNAQGTHFFMINDSGTYYLRTPKAAPGDAAFEEKNLIARARDAKVKVLNERLDVPAGQRAFPAYLDSNRFLSNLPGTTLFLPVVDLSHQYINALMYLLTQPKGARPTIVDDRNFYQVAGVKRWVNNGFLNEDLKLPLGVIGMGRTQIEADLLLQNLMLVADSMGLGAWIHATIGPAVMLGDPKMVDTYGPMLGFEFATPKWRPLDLLRWRVPLPNLTNLRAHPIGLKAAGEYLIRAKCPPYYESMSAAVDSVIAGKFGPGGVYQDIATFKAIFKDNFGEKFLAESAAYEDDVIECTRDICNYIYETHGRFPAHCDAIHVPGVWLQVHHAETEYYDRFFRNGLSDTQRRHRDHWHGPEPRDTSVEASARESEPAPTGAR